MRMPTICIQATINPLPAPASGWKKLISITRKRAITSCLRYPHLFEMPRYSQMLEILLFIVMNQHKKKLPYKHKDDRPINKSSWFVCSWLNVASV